MFEPGTSKDTSNCLLPKNSSKNDLIGKDEKVKKTKRYLIESLVTEAADRLNVQFVAKKKEKDEIKDKKRKSCSVALEKPKNNKLQRLSCGATICSNTNDLGLNRDEPAQGLKISDYLVVVNNQLIALQELPVIQKSTTSEIQDFISKLDESQVENFLRKKADGIRSSVDSDPNARSILSFIQKKIALPVLENSRSLAGPSSSKKLENEKNVKNDTIKVSSENSKSDSQECYKQKSEKSATKPKVIEVMDDDDDVTEVTSTSENEITSSSEFKTIQSNALEKLNSIDLLKLNQKDLTEFIAPLLTYKEGESNSNSVELKKTKALDVKDSSEQEMKIALKKNIQNFFLQLISFADMLKTCTDIIGKNESDEIVKAKVETTETTLSTENSTEESLEKTANKKLNSHCHCCTRKSTKNNCEENNSTLKISKGSETEGKPSDLLSAKNNTSPENIDISSTTTLEAVTSSSTVVATTESKIVKDENFIGFDDVSDDALIKSEDDTPNEGIFKCKKCNYTTKSKLKLKRHVKYAKKNPSMYNHKRKAVKISEN